MNGSIIDRNTILDFSNVLRKPDEVYEPDVKIVLIRRHDNGQYGRDFTQSSRLVILSEAKNLLLRSMQKRPHLIVKTPAPLILRAFNACSA